MGTPAYMSPEQFKGERADARSDQFSLCVALYEGLYGERPFAGATWSELMTNVLDGRWREVPTNTSVPTWLREVVLRGLAVETGERWPLMGALIEALEDDSEARWRARRNLAGIVLVVVAVVVGLGRLAWNAQEKADTEASAKVVVQGQLDDALTKLELALATEKEVRERTDALRLEQAQAIVAIDPNRAIAPLADITSFDNEKQAGEAWNLWCRKTGAEFY